MNKNKIIKISTYFLLTFSIFTCLCFTNSKAKADTNIPNANSYMLNLQDFYQTMRSVGLSTVDINAYVGTTVISTSEPINFFKVNNIWFDRIYLQISTNYEMTLYYFNLKTSQRVDVVDANNVIDYNALNINIIDLTLIDDLIYLFTPSQTVYDLNAEGLFSILFTNVKSSFPIRSGIYHYNFPDLFGNLVNVGANYRMTDISNFNPIYWTYSYIIYSTNDIVLTFDDNSTIYCHTILIGGSSDDYLTYYFLKDDFSSYKSLYYFDLDNTQYLEYGYLVYDEIDYIYFPYNTGIYELNSDEPTYLYSSDYVFNNTFIYGYQIEVHGWNDFFLNIIDVPVMYLRSLTNFEIFGVNLFYTLTGLMTTLFIIWIIRKF